MRRGKKERNHNKHITGGKGIEETDRYFRLIAENLTDMIALVDITGHRLYCTPNYSFLDDPTKLPGTNSFDEIHPEDKERIKSIFFDTVRTGQGQATQYRLLLKDGTIRHIQSHGIAIRAKGGKVEKLLIVSRDITEIRAATERQNALELQLSQAEKLSALGKTISGVAHELNNPLTGIMGFCQLLLRDETIQDNSRQREDITTIFHEAERCQKIVRNLTTFARKHKPEKTFLGINGLLEDSLSLQDYQMCNHNINITKELEENLPKTMADRHQLQQVFINLIVNAQDAMGSQPDNKTLSVKTKKMGNFIRVEIADSGPGISDENLTSIFEPFFTTKGIGKGTGLGLSLSFGIVSEHGGRIWAENIPGRGARFCVELPIIENLMSPGTNKGKSENISLKGQRVLIIDDEEQIINLIVRTCRLLNLSSDTARDPIIARRKLETGTYDVVLCDYRLPGQNGIELHNWAVKLRPTLKDIWVFMTGSSESEELLGTGCPVLLKPFSLELFQETLTAVLKKAHVKT